MDDNFDGYVTKVLNNEETEILKELLIKSNYYEIKIRSITKFPMFYMPNMEFTMKNLEVNKKNSLFFK